MRIGGGKLLFDGNAIGRPKKRFSYSSVKRSIALVFVALPLDELVAIGVSVEEVASNNV